MGREIEFHAWCYGIEFGIEDIIETLPVGTEIVGLRWGPAYIPLALQVAADRMETVMAILEEAERVLEISPRCFPGRGTLVLGAEQPAASSLN